MNLCIIGGGLTGLAAAYALSSRHTIDVLEKNDVLGGCLSSYHIKDYWIEKFYHHCFSGDRTLIRLLHELGLTDSLEWRNGTTGYYAHGHIYPLNTPFEILRYPEIGLIDKVRLASLIIDAKKMDPERLDSTTAENFITDNSGRRNYTSFFEPLLKSKFGEHRSEVSAAWLVQRIKIRSNRGFSGERLGYLNGGFHVFVDALTRRILKYGANVTSHNPAIKIEKSGDQWNVNGTRYDAVLSTIPPGELWKIGGPELPAIPYQGAACLSIGVGKDVADGIYWLNMKDEAPYGAVVTHTNFIPKERYGEHIVYLASYFTGKIHQNFDELMLDDFKRRFSVSDADIHWERFAVDPFAGPIYTVGFRKLIPAYEQKGFFIAGMFSLPNYPERSMDGSVSAGFKVAHEIEHKLSR